MLHLHITASCRVGCVRINNEDMILVGEHLLRNNKISADVNFDETDRLMIAVADGMGGHNYGEVASEETLKNLRFYFGDLPGNMSVSDFQEAMYGWQKSICLAISSKGQNDPAYRNMGTTLVGLAYYAGQFFWMNCGDSRLYLLHHGVLQQLTTDHSIDNLLGREKHSSQIYNCIGGGCKNSYLDIGCLPQPIEPGDVLMLCSDGLTDMISDDEVHGLLSRDFDADALCEAAEDAGGRDNISVAVVRIDE